MACMDGECTEVTGSVCCFECENVDKCNCKCDEFDSVEFAEDCEFYEKEVEE